MTNKIYAVLILSILLASSCQKNTNEFSPYPLDGHIDLLLEEIKETETLFSVNIGENQIITLEEKVDLLFTQETLLSERNNIDVSWLGLDNTTELFIHELPQYQSGFYLSPIKTFKIGVGDSDVEINSDSPMELLIEQAHMEDLELFTFQNEIWEPMTEDHMISFNWTDSTGEQKEGYKIIINKAGWYTLSSKVNFQSEDFTNMCVELTGEYTQSNTMAFVYMDNEIMVELPRTREQGEFCSSMSLPLDKSGKVIVLSNLRKGDFEIFVAEFNVEIGLIVAPVMEIQSAERIRTILKDI